MRATELAKEVFKFVVLFVQIVHISPWFTAKDTSAL